MNPGDRVKLTGAAWRDLGLNGAVVTVVAVNPPNLPGEMIFEHQGNQYVAPVYDYSVTTIND